MHSVISEQIDGKFCCWACIRDGAIRRSVFCVSTHVKLSGEICMDTGLSGKTVLITGAASGIGYATALAFAREGAHLVLIDRDKALLAERADELRKQGVRFATAAADVSRAEGTAAALEALLAEMPDGPDVLVNNVGFAAPKAFMDISDDEWEMSFQINFMAAARMTRKLLPLMRKREGAAIVNNASDLGRQPEAIPADYAAMKAALLSLTKSLARAEAPAIRVNAVAPGPIWTPFWTNPGGFADSLAAVHGMPPREAVEHEMKLRQLPLARMGEPEEVANVIVFMASPLASFVTGSVWGIDGGSIRSLI
jgi:NAD(P)-dependent dehydrogenase (short-subunit alcohol dehydrogenase family)